MTELLLRLCALVEKIGAPLAIAAWLTVFGGAIALSLALWRVKLDHAGWMVAGVVSVLSFAAHLLDYFLTLAITPDLSLEANPIWRVAVTLFGLPGAKLYALTGKILLSILAFEMFAWYLHARCLLFPEAATTFSEFIRRFGETEARIAGVGLRRLGCFFAFVFAWIGPYFFYVSFLNAVGNWAPDYYGSFPGPVPAISVWLTFLVVAFFQITWRAFRRKHPLQFRDSAQCAGKR